MSTLALKVWAVSYGPRMVEVAAETESDALRVALTHLDLSNPAWLRVAKIDRCIIVEVK